MKSVFIGMSLLISSVAQAEGPSFSCESVKPGSMEALICQDEALSHQDRIMAKVYAKAKATAAPEMQGELKAMQRGWIKGRDACWQAEDKNTCVFNVYQQRRVTLQAKYKLVDA